MSKPCNTLATQLEQELHEAKKRLAEQTPFCDDTWRRLEAFLDQPGGEFVSDDPTARQTFTELVRVVAAHILLRNDYSANDDHAYALVIVINQVLRHEHSVDIEMQLHAYRAMLYQFVDFQGDARSAAQNAINGAESLGPLPLAAAWMLRAEVGHRASRRHPLLHALALLKCLDHDGSILLELRVRHNLAQHFRMSDWSDLRYYWHLWQLRALEKLLIKAGFDQQTLTWLKHVRPLPVLLPQV